MMFHENFADIGAEKGVFTRYQMLDTKLCHPHLSVQQKTALL
jgi:hypothetical protein